MAAVASVQQQAAVITTQPCEDEGASKAACGKGQCMAGQVWLGWAGLPCPALPCPALPCLTSADVEAWVNGEADASHEAVPAGHEGGGMFAWEQAGRGRDCVRQRSKRRAGTFTSGCVRTFPEAHPGRS